MQKRIDAIPISDSLRRIVCGGLLAAALLFSGGASAQTAGGTSGNDEAMRAQMSRKAGKARSFCKGDIEGRWRVRCYAPSVTGTLIISKNGWVKKVTDPRERWSSFKFPASKVIGGRLYLNDPIRDNSPGALNQCYMEGSLRLAERKRGPKHKVFFSNMFINKGNDLMNGTAFVDGSSTGCTATKY